METKKEENMEQGDSTANVAEQPKEIKNPKHRVRFAIIAVILIVVGLAAGYVLGVIGYIKVIGPYFSKIEYQRAMEEYLKPYKEDFVGGNTPEETIDMFIDALKKEDYELASRYFVIDKWEKMREKLKSGRVNISQAILELEYAKNNWNKEDVSNEKINYWYNTTKESIKMTNEIYLAKNINGKWKIEVMYIYYLAE